MIELESKVIMHELEGHKPAYHYKSGVADIKGTTFLLYMPQIKRVVMRPPLGSEHQFTFYTEGGIYSGNGQILDYVTQSNVLLLKVEIPQLHYAQRRDFFRVDVTIPFHFTLKAPDEAPTDEPTLYKGNICNLSASGLCFITDKELAEHSMIHIHFPAEILSDDVLGHILSVIKCTTDGSDAVRYKIRLKYSEIDSKKQDSIVRYVFQTEREFALRKRKSAQQR